MMTTSDILPEVRDRGTKPETVSADWQEIEEAERIIRCLLQARHNGDKSSQHTLLDKWRQLKRR